MSTRLASRPSYRWWVVGMLWLVCFFNYADRQAIFSVFPLLREEMGLSNVQLGIVAGAFMWVYAAFGQLGGCPERNKMVAALPSALRSAHGRLAKAEHGAYAVTRVGRSAMLRRLRRPGDDAVRIDADALSDWGIGEDVKLLFGFLLRDDDIGGMLAFPFALDDGGDEATPEATITCPVIPALVDATGD